MFFFSHIISQNPVICTEVWERSLMLLLFEAFLMRKWNGFQFLSIFAGTLFDLSLIIKFLKCSHLISSLDFILVHVQTCICCFVAIFNFGFSRPEIFLFFTSEIYLFFFKHCPKILLFFFADNFYLSSSETFLFARLNR